MSADRFRTVARHQADDQTADGGDDDHKQAEMVVGGRNESRREAAVETEVGDQADQAQEDLCDQAGCDSDRDRDHGDEDDAAIYGGGALRRPLRLECRAERGRDGQAFGG